MKKQTLKNIILETIRLFPKQALYLLILILIESIVVASSVLTIIPFADYLLDPSLDNPSKVTIVVINILKIFNVAPDYWIFGIIFIFTNIIRSFLALFISYSILKIKYSIIKQQKIELTNSNSIT